MDVSFKFVGSVLAILASIAGIGSFLVSIMNKPDSTIISNASHNEKPIHQSTNGSSSPNIANVQGNVTLTINSGKSKLDIPSYDFSLQPFPGWRRDPNLGEKFNDAMFKFLDQTVYLSITLSEDMTHELSDNSDEYGRKIFSVPNNADDNGYGGAEYLVHISKNENSPFEIHNDIAVLSGYFKIFDINGPRQGFMSVNLRPVKVD